MSAYQVLMTKKIAPALVQKAKQQDVNIEEMEFVEIVPCEEKDRVREVAEKPALVAFTSKNAVNIVAGLLGKTKPSWKIFCIDGATRTRAEHCFGAPSIAGTAINARQLGAVIAGDNTAKKEVVFFCGDKRRDDLPHILDHEDIDVEEITVYETRLSPEEIGRHFDGIAFFSPSAVESFFSVNVIDDRTVFYAIGDTTSECLKKFAPNRVITCPKASEEDMVDTILGSIKNTNE